MRRKAERELELSTRHIAIRPVWKSGTVKVGRYEGWIVVGKKGNAYFSRVDEATYSSRWSEPKSTQEAALEEGKKDLNSWAERYGETGEKLDTEEVDQAMESGEPVEHRFTEQERADILRPEHPRSPEEEERMIGALHEEMESGQWKKPTRKPARKGR